MSLFAKIMVVVNLILAVVFLSAAGTFLNATESWKSNYDVMEKEKDGVIEALTGQVDAQKTEKEAAKSAANTAQTAKAVAEAGMKTQQDSNNALMAQNNALQAQLEVLTTAQGDLQKINNESQTLVDTLRGDLARTEGEKRDANDMVQTLQEQIAGLNQQVADAEASLAAQEMANSSQADQIDQLGTTIAMYNKHFGPLPGGVVMKPLSAVVQAVDNANDIYILSVGSKDGVQEGYEFTIHRGGNYVATVVVDKVFANYASARTKDGLKNMDAQAGDSANTHL